MAHPDKKIQAAAIMRAEAICRYAFAAIIRFPSVYHGRGL